MALPLYTMYAMYLYFKRNRILRPHCTPLFYSHWLFINGAETKVTKYEHNRHVNNIMKWRFIRTFLEPLKCKYTNMQNTIILANNAAEYIFCLYRLLQFYIMLQYISTLSCSFSFGWSDKFLFKLKYTFLRRFSKKLV